MCLHAGLHVASVLGEHVGHHPHALQVGDAEELVPAVELLAEGDVPREHEAIGGRDDLDGVRNDARLVHLLALELRDAHVLELHEPLLQVQVDGRDGLVLPAVLLLPHRPVVAGQVHQVDLHRRHRRRGVEAAQDLVLVHAAAGGDGRELADRAFDAGVDVVHARLVGRHAARNADRPASGGTLDGADGDAEQALLVGGHGDRALRVLRLGLHFHELHVADRADALVVLDHVRVHRAAVVRPRVELFGRGGRNRAAREEGEGESSSAESAGRHEDRSVVSVVHVWDPHDPG